MSLRSRGHDTRRRTARESCRRHLRGAIVYLCLLHGMIDENEAGGHEDE